MFLFFHWFDNLIIYLFPEKTHKFGTYVSVPRKKILEPIYHEIHPQLHFLNK